MPQKQTPPELAPMPGDNLVRGANVVSNVITEIDAPIETVYGLLVQTEDGMKTMKEAEAAGLSQLELKEDLFPKLTRACVSLIPHWPYDQVIRLAIG